MGVYCSFHSATSEQLAAIAGHHPFVNLLWGEAGWESQRSFFARLRHRAPACLNDMSASMSISLDKAWHGLHYLFTGAANGSPLPEGFLLSGGSDIGSSSRVVLPNEAARFGAFISSLSPEALRARYDPAVMERLQIYPDIIWTRDGVEALDWLMELYELLPTFFRDIAEEHHGYVITIG